VNDPMVAEGELRGCVGLFNYRHPPECLLPSRQHAASACADQRHCQTGPLLPPLGGGSPLRLVWAS
jgi:hypothetical protein